MSTDKNKPVKTFRDGELKVSVFQNQGKNGDYFSYVPGRIYTDQNGQARETHSLTGADPLRMANLLNRSYERIAAFKQQMKAQSRPGNRER